MKLSSAVWQTGTVWRYKGAFYNTLKVMVLGVSQTHVKTFSVVAGKTVYNIWTPDSLRKHCYPTDEVISLDSGKQADKLEVELTTPSTNIL